MLRGLMLSLTAVALSLTAARSVVAQPEIHLLNIPFTTAMLNPCNGETVVIQGNVDVTVQITVDSAGGFTNVVHIGSHGQGLASTRYVFDDTFDSSLKVAGPPNTVATTETLTHLLNRTGSTGTSVLGDNFVVKATFHMTFNGTGVPTAFVDNFMAECRG